jgi:hypothetical protein
MIKGYKVFDKNLQCRGFQFEVGKDYEEEEAILCEKGFHFHENSNDLFNYYDFNSDNIVCEVGCEDVVTGDDKSVCKRMKVVRQLDSVEVLELINTGKRNTGRNNSGDGNSGDGNSGDGNSGDGNSGYGNSGDGNSGYGNSGDGNSGDGNSGYRNSGYRNSGNENSGNRNSGYGNSGDGNSGNENSGNWNSGNWNTGFFNVDEPTIRMFNKDTGLKLSEIDIPYINLELVFFVHNKDLPESEQNESLGGVYKTRTYKEAWEKISKEKPETIEKITKLPNFNPEIFEEITGLKI